MTDFDLNEREDDLIGVEHYYRNQTFVWEGNTYNCICNPGPDTAILGLGGVGGDATTQIIVRQSQFINGSFPSKADVITFNGGDYEIDSITLDGAGVAYVINLILPSP